MPCCWCEQSYLLCSGFHSWGLEATGLRQSGFWVLTRAAQLCCSPAFLYGSFPSPPGRAESRDRGDGIVYEHRIMCVHQHQRKLGMVLLRVPEAFECGEFVHVYKKVRWCMVILSINWSDLTSLQVEKCGFSIPRQKVIVCITCIFTFCNSYWIPFHMCL